MKPMPYTCASWFLTIEQVTSDHMAKLVYTTKRELELATREAAAAQQEAALLAQQVWKRVCAASFAAIAAFYSPSL